ncbi:CAP domain-containing protein [Streptomyces sp. NPDC012888]|uniref:CAP domain-containing protein n=1 Tax=Streptomyces sp. NPDC012888 TaxID=3364855 RepID=UPI0036953FE2
MHKHRRTTHFRKAAIAVAALGITGIPTAAMASQETPPAAPAATATTSPTAKVVALVNRERAKAGCRPVKVNAKLTKAAQSHSRDQARHHRMSHTGSDGSNPGQRITRAGYQWRTYGENVAYGYNTPAKVMNAWMHSPGHRANILNCSFKEIGVGLSGTSHYWTQNFATAR